MMVLQWLIKYNNITKVTAKEHQENCQGKYRALVDYISKKIAKALPWQMFISFYLSNYFVNNF